MTGEKVSALTGRLLRNRAAELQRSAAFLATACGQYHDGAQERNDGDLLGTHDCTSNNCNVHTDA